ncbi:MAG: hypothetical protein B7X90_16655 [Novosphingobium sp. 17-62-19]|uniref:hypothetical protein n=1 Tax=Novosphingobium sp. 17-62-19 TaxID=1970406 RepID=UPI000BC8DC48|nr:hypothetical protein [Novosphingobium sp. 17-62-19]OYX96334.1 MAG: hypothetical protein B7Y74_01595 [Novosphingobium sp. 35-62-5]OZA16942.1 MAG: hypothetical protein B7X90_16655 [Novosphingobium sp. 17-62-19]HQS98615.1 hypothetical protein [Novosphingobium sp.]
MLKFAFRPIVAAAVAAMAWSGFVPNVAVAQQALIRGVGNAVSAAPDDALTFADLVSLADASEVVLRVQVKKANRLKPEQAPGLAPGMARLLVEGRTQTVLSGPAMGEKVRYLADVPLDAKGKVLKLNKRVMLVFARTVAGRPGELRLVDGGAQIAWSGATETRIRAILTELLSPEAPPRIKGVREVLYVPGNLVGEGETQVFLQTENNEPVSVTVVRRPGMDKVWGVSLSEIVDQAARPPERDTLTWYRLACFLPRSMPAGASLSGSADQVRAAAADYAFVVEQLGECVRTRPAVER